MNREEVGTGWVLGLVLALAESSVYFIWSPGCRMKLNLAKAEKGIHWFK